MGQAPQNEVQHQALLLVGATPKYQWFSKWARGGHKMMDAALLESGPSGTWNLALSAPFPLSGNVALRLPLLLLIHRF